jgi:hypothetical protein
MLVALLVVGLVAGVQSRVSASEGVESMLGKMKIGSLLQFWYQADQSNAATDAPFNSVDTFRLRRAEIRATGEINPQTLWLLAIDPATVREDVATRKSVLQDFVITYKLTQITDNLSVDFGQYKIPYGLAGLESSAKLDFAERPAICSVLKWSDWRDLGAMARYENKLAGVGYVIQAGAFDGDGQNLVDTNETKDFAGRIVITPAKGLSLGYAQHENTAGAVSTKNSYNSIEAKFERGSVSAKGEYATADLTNSTVKAATWWASAGYTVKKDLQLVVRYDWWDPNTADNTAASKIDAKNDTTVGLNVFLQNNNKIQLNYIIRQEEGASVDNNVFLVNFQVTTY